MSDPTVVSLFDQDPGRGQDLVLDAPAGWPAPPDHAAYHGLPGEIVARIAPHTRPIRSRSSPSCSSRAAR